MDSGLKKGNLDPREISAKKDFTGQAGLTPVKLASHFTGQAGLTGY